MFPERRWTVEMQNRHVNLPVDLFKLIEVLRAIHRHSDPIRKAS